MLILLGLQGLGRILATVCIRILCSALWPYPSNDGSVSGSTSGSHMMTKCQALPGATHCIGIQSSLCVGAPHLPMAPSPQPDAQPRPSARREQGIPQRSGATDGHQEAVTATPALC